MKTKKWVKILLACFLGAISVASIVFMCLINVRSSGPNDIFINTGNGHIIFSTSQPSKGYGYTFKFREGKNEYFVKSDKNMLEYDSEVASIGVTVGKTYNVSVAVNGEFEGGKSFYSCEIEWNAKQYLDSPNVTLKNEQLTWEKVENADYYEINYNHQGEMLSVTTRDTSYPIENLQGGVSDIFVFAKSSNKNYLTSESSNKLSNVTIVHEILPILSMSFIKSSGTLTIITQEMFDSFNVYIGSNVYTIKNFYTIGERISCNLDFVYNGESKIGVKPLAGGDPYKKYTGKVTYIEVK